MYKRSSKSSRHILENLGQLFIVGDDGLGMRINIDVLNAQNTYAQSQYNLAQAQYNTILGNVNLKAAIGQLGDEDVQYINALLSNNASTSK